MRWTWVLGLFLFLLNGCNQNQVMDKKNQEAFNLKLNPSSLAMFFKNGNIKLGESIHSIFQKISKPESSIILNTLPAVLSSPFKAHGWERGNDAYAFIIYHDVIYLVLQSHEQVTKGYVDQILEQYQKTFLAPNKKIKGSKGFYWFWENGGQRLMICYTKDANQQGSITISLGEKQLMKKLRMDPVSAQEDLIDFSEKFKK